MSLRRIFLAAFVALPLAACNFSSDEGPAPGASDQAISTTGTAHGQQSAAVTRVDLRSTPALWSNVSSQGLNAQALALTADEEFVTLRQNVTDGLVHTRTQQTFHGLAIWGEHVITTTDRRGQVVRMHGNLVQGLGNANLDLTPKFGPEQALRTMQSLHRAGLGGMNMEYKNETSDLVIYLNNGRPTLSYAVSFFADVVGGGEPSRPTYLVDARSGDILFQFEGLTTAEVATGPGGNLKTGEYEYGTDFGFNDVTVSGTTCTMNNANVKTVNLNHGTSGSTAWSFPCYRNTTKAINGAYSPLNDAHYFGGVVFNMYQAWVGAAPLTFQLTMRVHYSNNYENAFWDGSAMTFGDGQSYFYPLVSLDVSSHEVSHGFTEQNSGLIYSGQSGGINEAFSDIAGEAAENYNNGSNDWLVGAQIFKGSGALRYMCDPPLDGSSIGHADDYSNGMDVHYSSGVYNKAFCLIGQTPGWTVEEAFLIFARANQNYWTPSTTYDSGFVGVQDAAGDLGLNVADVDAAFAAVGVPGSGGGGDPSCEGYCGGATPFGCYCDTACTTFGDCCPDYEPVCNGTGGYPGNELEETNLGGSQGSWSHYTLTVPSDAATLEFNITGGSGDADMYVKFGSEPTTSSWDCRPYMYGNVEKCSFTNPSAGTWHVSLRGWSSYSGVTLTGDYDI